MRRLHHAIALLIVSIACAPPALLAAGEAPSYPVVLAFERFHAKGADPIEGGRLLLGELVCASCHEASAVAAREQWILPKQGPDLEDVAGRVSTAWLKRYLADPHAVQPGTTMPSVLAGMPAGARDATIDSLVHFLTSVKKSSFNLAAPSGAAVARGEELYHRVGCVACHNSRRAAIPQVGATADGDEDTPPAEPYPARPLAALEKKYSIDSLAAFLRDPLHVRRSGRMPRVPLSAAEATDVAHYLLKDSDAPAALRYAYFEGDWHDLPRFDTLTPVASGGASGFELGMQRRQDHFALRFDGFLRIEREGEYRFWLTSDDGSRLLVDGRVVIDHGKVHSGSTMEAAVRLSPGLHPIQVQFFEEAGEQSLTVEYAGPGIQRTRIPSAVLVSTDKPPPPPSPFVVDSDWAEIGGRLFSKLECAACHTVGSSPQSTLSAQKPLASLDPDRGCLSPAPAVGRPHYALSATQLAAIRAALAVIKNGTVPAANPKDRIARTLTALNCTACHERDGRAGVPLAAYDLFSSDDKDLGDEGRIPPRLTGVGDKLEGGWLRSVLLDAGISRPYMHARMPQFGEAQVGHLPADFAVVDRKPDEPPKTRDAPAVAVAAGRELVGREGLNCIACHMYNRHKSTGIQAMDLAFMADRLRPDWFHRYMLDPMVYRPGTRMPQAWPNGKSTRPHILGGDTNRQIAAVWAYLAEGRKAKFPEGLTRQSMEIIVGGEAVVYRNFLLEAGNSGIAVGYPEQVNLAYDPRSMRLALIWQGRFLDAKQHWSDRGAGVAGPLGEKAMRLVDGPPLAVLAGDVQKTPWPTATGKEAGFQFLGYRLDELRRPTFRYKFQGTEVEDFFAASEAKAERTLTRTVTLTAREPIANLWYRVAAGKIETKVDGTYRVNDRLSLRVTLPPELKPVLRPGKDGQELLLPVSGNDAKLAVEYRW